MQFGLENTQSFKELQKEINHIISLSDRISFYPTNSYSMNFSTFNKSYFTLEQLKLIQIPNNYSIELFCEKKENLFKPLKLIVHLSDTSSIKISFILK